MWPKKLGRVSQHFTSFCIPRSWEWHCRCHSPGRETKLPGRVGRVGFLSWRILNKMVGVNQLTLLVDTGKNMKKYESNKYSLFGDDAASPETIWKTFLRFVQWTNSDLLHCWIKDYGGFNMDIWLVALIYIFCTFHLSVLNKWTSTCSLFSGWKTISCDMKTNEFRVKNHQFWCQKYINMDSRMCVCPSVGPHVSRRGKRRRLAPRTTRRFRPNTLKDTIKTPGSPGSMRKTPKTTKCGYEYLETETLHFICIFRHFNFFFVCFFPKDGFHWLQRNLRNRLITCRKNTGNKIVGLLWAVDLPIGLRHVFIFHPIFETRLWSGQSSRVESSFARWRLTARASVILRAENGWIVGTLIFLFPKTNTEIEHHHLQKTSINGWFSSMFEY